MLSLLLSALLRAGRTRPPDAPSGCRSRLHLPSRTLLVNFPKTPGISQPRTERPLSRERPPCDPAHAFLHAPPVNSRLTHRTATTLIAPQPLAVQCPIVHTRGAAARR